MVHNQECIRDGLIAYGATEQLHAKLGDPELLKIFNAHVANLGYALLLKRHRPDIVNASPQEIEAAAWETMPPVALLFWCFRIMIALGFYFIPLFAVVAEVGRQPWTIDGVLPTFLSAPACLPPAWRYR